MEILDTLSVFLRQFWDLWLMILFLGIVAWAYWPKNKDRFEDDAMIPLKEQDRNEERTNGGSL